MRYPTIGKHSCYTSSMAAKKTTAKHKIVQPSRLGILLLDIELKVFILFVFLKSRHTHVVYACYIYINKDYISCMIPMIVSPSYFLFFFIALSFYLIVEKVFGEHEEISLQVSFV